jgi:hypothetical protein
LITIASRLVAFLSSPGSEEFVERHVAVTVSVRVLEVNLCLGPHARVFGSLAHGEELCETDLAVFQLQTGCRPFGVFTLSYIAARCATIAGGSLFQTSRCPPLSH